MKHTLIVGLTIFLVACGVGKNKYKDAPKGGLNIFSLQQDRALGMQVASQIESNPNEYPILDSASNVAAYKYIYYLRDKILATGKVKHKDDFRWQVKILKKDSVLNAFCTPGGHIYIYTGIIKYLENEAQLAGVMGHEMGHADLRHSTRQMTEMFGIQILAAAALGKQEELAKISTALIGLTFSRKHETEADRMSVEYLCGTSWPADGAAGFFEKIKAEGGSSPPAFLSTHPSPENRIENFHKWAAEKNCPGKDDGKMSYKEFQKLFD